MADKAPTQEIATLGLLCGIASEYRDNRGKRRRTSLATCRALLAAMRVPCATPSEIREEITRRQKQESEALLPPAAVVWVRGGRLSLPLAAAAARLDFRPGLEVQMELISESGQTWRGSAPLTRSGPAGMARPQVELPDGLAPGYYRVRLRLPHGAREKARETFLIAAPPAIYLPPCLAGGRRLWGFNIPLYALRSARNWGMGDFTDLKEFTRWAGELGAAFVGVNPLHAPLPGPEADPSPYSPATRLFSNFLYLDVEAVPELAHSPQAHAIFASQEFGDALNRLQAEALVAYPDVHALKRRVLEALFDAFREVHGPEAPRTERGRQFSRFIHESGESLVKFATYAAMADLLQDRDWRRWPPPYHDPEGPAVAALAAQNPRLVGFHQYLQWLASEQMAGVRDQARTSGLPFTLYQDLALGAAAGGFETWAYPELFAAGAAMGAPPDAFNPRGQDWGLPPLIPERLQASVFRLFIDTLRANLPPEGLLRLDHVMSLFRLYWIPPGRPAAQGAYVRYPARELLAILALESRRRRTFIIGEDLGTVSPGIRRDLKRAGVFSYRVFYFEGDGAGRFRPPNDYPRSALAAVTTHDLPTLAGFWKGADIELKGHFHLYPDEGQAAAEARARPRERAEMVRALAAQRLIPPEQESPLLASRACPEAVRLGVLEYLGQSGAALMEVRLEEVFGLTAQQNLPGTTAEHPNWRQKFQLSLEEMQKSREALHLAKIMAQHGRGSGE